MSCVHRKSADRTSGFSFTRYVSACDFAAEDQRPEVWWSVHSSTSNFFQEKKTLDTKTSFFFLHGRNDRETVGSMDITRRNRCLCTKRAGGAGTKSKKTAYSTYRLFKTLLALVFLFCWARRLFPVPLAFFFFFTRKQPQTMEKVWQCIFFFAWRTQVTLSSAWREKKNGDGTRVLFLAHHRLKSQRRFRFRDGYDSEKKTCESNAGNPRFSNRWSLSGTRVFARNPFQHLVFLGRRRFWCMRYKSTTLTVEKKRGIAKMFEIHLRCDEWF